MQVFTPFAGRVVRILAQPGERVKKGQALALVASPDFGQAQSDAKRAQAHFGVADQSLKRVRELFQGGVLSQRELTAAEADFMRAEGELKHTNAGMALYRNPGLGISCGEALKNGQNRDAVTACGHKTGRSLPGP